MNIIVPTLVLAGSVYLGPSQLVASIDQAPPRGVLNIQIENAANSAAAAQPADELDQAAQAVEQATANSDRSVRQAHRAMEVARSRIAMADLDVTEPGELQTPIEDGFGFAIAGSGRASNQPLIIRGGGMDSNAVSTIQEDLAVMTRILNKTIDREVGREARDSAMGIVLSALPGSRRPQSIYLEGYRALFLANVKFPLVPAPAKEEEKAEKTADTTWEQTKRELYGQKTSNIRVWNVPGSDSGPEYNSEQVENLKKELVEAMKNASNIRDLKPDEVVTIAVMGNRPAGGTTHIKHATNRGGKGGKSEVYLAEGGRPAPRESTMTLRAKKSDIDSYAKGAIDLEQFKKKVAVATY